MFKIKCEQCAFTFPSQEDLFAHFDFCSDYQLPDDKNSTKPAKRKLRRSSGPSIVEVGYEDEELSLPKRTRREPPESPVDKNPKPEQEALICKGCDRRFSNSDEFIRHVYTGHGLDPMKNYLARSEPIPGILEDKCDTCHTYYKNSTGVALHNCEKMVECRNMLMENSTTQICERKVHPCPACYEIFNMAELINHIQNSHTGLMAFIARSCPIPDALEKQCDKCRCFYRDALDMSNHDCDKMIQCRKELGRGQYDFNEETYVCRGCHNLFNVDDMINHFQKHRHQKKMGYIARSGCIPGVNEVQCRLCYCYFRGSSGLNNHNCYQFMNWRLSIQNNPLSFTNDSTITKNNQVIYRRIKEMIAKHVC